MARTGISYLDVKKAAEACQQKSEMPTVDSCRRILGTGSRTTINNYLKQWRGEQDIFGGDSEVTALPADLVTLIRNLWERLCADSQQQVALARDEWEQQRGDFQRQLHENETASAALQEKLNIANAALTESQQQCSDSEEKLKQLNLDYHQQSADLTMAEQRFLDRQTEIDRLSALVKHVQDNLTHYQQEAQTLREQEQLALDKLRQDYDGKIKVLETQFSEKQQQLVQATNANTALTQNLEKSKTEYKRLTQSETQLKYDLQVKSAESSQLEKQVETLEFRLDKNQKALHENERSQTELTVTVKLKEQRLAQKDAALKQQDNKLAGVMQSLDEAKAENAYLKGQLAALEKQL